MAGGSTAGGATAGGATAGGSTAGGSSAGGSAGGAVNNPCATGAAFFCDDFEGAPVGSAAPAPWSRNDAIKVTAAAAYRGARALDIPGGQSLNFNLSAARDVVFIRVMLRSSFLPSTMDSRFGILSARTAGDYTATTDANPNLIAFYKWPNGEAAIDSMAVVPTAAWSCLEASYDRTTRVYRAWLNGAEVTDFAAAQSGPAVPSGWTSVQVQNVIYHGGSGNLLVDDVALGSSRVGCP